MEDFTILYTTKQEPIYIDSDDYELLSQYTWRLHYGYAETDIKVNNKWSGLSMHRLLMNAQPNQLVDHINRIHNDNRKSNLRFATKLQNKTNQGTYKNNKSGHSGIYRNQSNKKWCVQINANNKRIYLGSFTNLEDAIKVRQEAEIQYFGEFRPI